MSREPATSVRGSDRAELKSFSLSTGTPIEVMRAWYRTQEFARHSHEYFTVGLMLSGTGSLWWRGGVQTLHPDEVVIIPPGEVHTGGLGESDRVLSYLAAHIPDAAVELCAASRGASSSSFHNGGPAIIRDARLCAELGRLACATSAGRFDPAEAEDAVSIAIESVVDWLVAQPPTTSQPRRADAPFVRIAREIIDECYADHTRTSLDALARAAGVTPFHLVREFTRSTGLSPHRYLVQRKVREACDLLGRGMAPSFVAAATGFVDQSHLTTQFRRYVGTTPASYRRGMSRRG